MKKFATNPKMVNYGIALALLGVLVFSLMSSVEGMESNNVKHAKEKVHAVAKKVASKIAPKNKKEPLVSKKNL